MLYSGTVSRTGMATVGVSLLERQRRYREAIEALRLLLAGTCCPGRRGRWPDMMLPQQRSMRAEGSLQLQDCSAGDAFYFLQGIICIGMGVFCKVVLYTDTTWLRPCWLLV